MIPYVFGKENNKIAKYCTKNNIKEMIYAVKK